MLLPMAEPLPLRAIKAHMFVILLWVLNKEWKKFTNL